MNIKSTDKILFEKLNKATIAKVVIGSRMYGLDDKNSDIDYLHIYATSENELISFIQTQHQIQFKIDNNDYNFVSLHNFVKNILNGDSTINFETIFSNALLNTDLEWLHNYKHSFINYTIIRSYLGLCNRDVKHYYKYTTEYDKLKRLKHIVRGYIYAKNMINHNFDFDKSNNEMKNIILDISTDKMVKEYANLISKLRNELNDKFNNNVLNYPQKIKVEDGLIITNDFINYCKSESFKNKQSILVDFDLYEIINSFENWVQY